MEDLFIVVADIANTAQISAAKHPRCLVNLRNIFENNDLEDFVKSLKKVMLLILQRNFNLKDLFVERGMQFFAEFCGDMEKKLRKNDDEDESAFLRKVIYFLLEYIDVVDVNLRARSCQFINKLLDQLIGIDLSIEICDAIQDLMIKRIRDPKVMIRIQAAIAICRLQDPGNVDCPVIGAYISAIEGDISGKMRKICVQNIALRKDVVGIILGRMRDVDDKVRLAAYTRSLSRPHFFKISERQMLLKYAMSEQSKVVEKFIEVNLIPSWLQYYENDYVKLIMALRLDADILDLEETVTVVQFVLQKLFSTQPFAELLEAVKTDEKKLLPIESLSWDSVLYWRFFLEHLKTLDENQQFNNEETHQIPELIDICAHIKTYCDGFNGDNKEKQAEKQFILWQMFHITLKYDFGDITGRQMFISLVSDLLVNINMNEELYGIILDNLANIMDNGSELVRFICGIASDILNPPQEGEVLEANEAVLNFEGAQCKVKINCLKEDLDNCIKQRDFSAANLIQNEITELEKRMNRINNSFVQNVEDIEPKKTDCVTYIKCLNVIGAMLSLPVIKKMNSMLETLMADVIMDLCGHENEIIQTKALKCFLLCCIICRDKATIGVNIFCDMLSKYKNKEEISIELLVMSIGAITDLLVLFGKDLVAYPRDVDPTDSFNEEIESIFTGGSSLAEVINILVGLLHDQNTLVQEQAGQGLCNLVLKRRIDSIVVLTKLILKWCIPPTDMYTERLQQRIGCMLQHLPSIPDSAYQFEKSIIPTIKAISKAGPNNPLLDVNVLKIAKFLLELSNMYPEGLYIHSNLSTFICCEIRDKPKKIYNVTFAKMLLLLDLPDDEMLYDDLLKLCDEIKDVTHEHLLLLYVNKFKTALFNLKESLLNKSKIEE